MTTAVRAPDTDPQRGAALVIVLLFAALLSGLAATALQGSASGARAATVFLDEMRADALGRGAADALGAHILQEGPPAQRGGAFAVRLAQAELAVDYRSESARVDLNKAPLDLLAAVLTAAGAEGEAVAAVRARLAAARDTGAPATAGPAATPATLFATGVFTPTGTPTSASAVTPSGPFAPQKGSAPLLEDVGAEVSHWALPDDVATRVIDALTVCSGLATVDPVLADKLVLTALLGDEARVDAYVAQRGAGFTDTGAALAPLPVPAQSFAGFADVSAVRALVRVTVAHRFTRRYEIVLDPPAFAGQAPRVLLWRPLF